jgi:hypothetical protein
VHATSIQESMSIQVSERRCEASALSYKECWVAGTSYCMGCPGFQQVDKEPDTDGACKETVVGGAQE